MAGILRLHVNNVVKRLGATASPRSAGGDMTDTYNIKMVFHGPREYVGPVDVVDCGLCNGWGSHEYGKCTQCNGIGKVSFPSKDNCEVCKGEKGGVKGNENRVDGKVMCDFCTSEWMDERDAMLKARENG